MIGILCGKRCDGVDSLRKHDDEMHPYDIEKIYSVGLESSSTDFKTTEAARSLNLPVSAHAPSPISFQVSSPSSKLEPQPLSSAKVVKERKPNRTVSAMASSSSLSLQAHVSQSVSSSTIQLQEKSEDEVFLERSSLLLPALLIPKGLG